MNKQSVSAFEMKDWNRSGFDAATAAEWMNTIDNPNEAKKWKDAGFSVKDVKGLLAQGFNFDEAVNLYGEFELYDSKSKNASKKFDEALARMQERQEKQQINQIEREQYFEKSPSKEFVDSLFGSTLNQYNKYELMKYLDGVTKKYEGISTWHWGDVLKNIGYDVNPETDITTQDATKYIKDFYETKNKTASKNKTANVFIGAIKSLLNDYEDDARLTPSDVVEEIKFIVDEMRNSQLKSDIEDAVVEYKQAQEEDMEEFGGRGDMDEAFEQFIVSVTSAIKQREESSSKITIDEYKIVPSPVGIGWFAVLKWDDAAGEYKHLSAQRSKELAEDFIYSQIQNNSKESSVENVKEASFPLQPKIEGLNKDNVKLDERNRLALGWLRKHYNNLMGWNEHQESDMITGITNSGKAQISDTGKAVELEFYNPSTQTVTTQVLYGDPDKIIPSIEAFLEKAHNLDKTANIEPWQETRRQFESHYTSKAPKYNVFSNEGRPDVELGDKYRKDGFWFMKGTPNFMGGRDVRITDPTSIRRLDHQVSVEQAIAEGKDIPSEVLADYPHISRSASSTDLAFNMGNILFVDAMAYIDECLREEWGSYLLENIPGADLMDTVPEVLAECGVEVDKNEITKIGQGLIDAINEKWMGKLTVEELVDKFPNSWGSLALGAVGHGVSPEDDLKVQEWMKAKGVSTRRLYFDGFWEEAYTYAGSIYDECVEKIQNNSKESSVEKKAELKLWQDLMKNNGLDNYKNYTGEHYDDYYVLLSQTRDSDTLEQSNFQTALDLLGGEGNDVIVVRTGHWGVGWIESIMIQKDALDKVAIAEEIDASLNNYPILDEDDYSTRQKDEFLDAYNHWFRDDILRHFGLEDVEITEEDDETAIYDVAYDCWFDYSGDLKHCANPFSELDMARLMGTMTEEQKEEAEKIRQVRYMEESNQPKLLASKKKVASEKIDHSATKDYWSMVLGKENAHAMTKKKTVASKIQSGSMKKKIANNAEWVELGFQPEVAELWIDAGFDDVEVALEWNKFFTDPYEAMEWELTDLSPEQAHEIKEEGISVEDYVFGDVDEDFNESPVRFYQANKKNNSVK